ncbi:hypothetical protein [Brevibacillus porteri]|uniref:Uncharacterized protein n=1 Tax=Brevibacillus porteri TaxID=2126350 RepID=A0ABX5FN17_9BACL|nr:hypothetical protein [Brevibacillus porteri]MED1802466.1 hypothetical protein [Brevibacillus porteri]MED2134112.1 hypothetical protein [Brevibacillus porteri]MED2745891.1 hypothetical protein [Brevibacillus porteri]MED2814051.1 hypothetical protein [Brevibacillus porteri]MED2894081.1 hypothetical protein [Brevibacillus porteri]
MKREDALFNWLQIQVVAEARPEDHSALDTAAFFLQLLQEDHQMSDIGYRQEGSWYVLFGNAESQALEVRYPAESVEALLAAIEGEPKYNCN